MAQSTTDYMLNKSGEFIGLLEIGRPLVLSFDLDNTLVNRDLGDNYLPRQTRDLIKSLDASTGVYVVPNTGRDIIGFQSFERVSQFFPDAILGSGSLIKCAGDIFFDEKSAIETKIIEKLIEAVRIGILPFIDLTHQAGRVVVYNNQVVDRYRDLFFSQNPRSWFGPDLPPTIEVGKFGQKLDSVYRIECPINKVHQDLYNELINRRENGIIYLAGLLSVDQGYFADYTFKRKAFFNDKYKGEVSFARLEKHSGQSSKGHGLKIWLDMAKLKKPIVIHVGDQDYGIVNDTLVKAEIPEAKLVMVGDRCQKNNPVVDLYLSGDIDQEVQKFMSTILDFSKGNISTETKFKI